MVKRFIISFLSCMLLMATQVVYSQVGPIQKGESLWCITERIGNTSDEILSKVCDIQEEFPIDCASQSTADEILMKVCNIQDELSLIDVDCTQGKISIFGAQISECRDDQVNVQFQYGIASSEVRSTESGSGQVEPSLIDGMACLVLNANTSGTAFIESKRFVRYRSGHETFGVFSAAFANSSANSTQWIGLFDNDNGAAVGFDGVDFSILYRVGGVDTIIPQSSFNKDKLDGSGASGFLLNPMNLNIFRISFGWLGASPIMYQILTEDGKWLVFHTIERGNLFTTPSFTNPIVPVRAEIDGTTVNNPLQLCTACWDAGIIGCPSVAGNRYFTKDNITTLSFNPQNPREQAVLTIRNKNIYRGKTNKVTIRAAVFGGGIIEQQNDKAVLRLYRNAIFTNVPTFSNVNTVNSVAEFSTNAIFDTTAGQTGVEVLAIGNNTDGSGPIINFIPKNEFSILLEPGDAITLTISNLTGGNNDVIGIIGWEELY